MIIVDVETTGLDPKINSIISIGALDFLNQSYRFYGECDIGKDAVIDYSAKPFEINGFSEKGIRDGSNPPLDYLMKQFLDWAQKCKNKTLGGHNVDFDRRFIEESLKKCGMEKQNLFGKRVVDLHSICYAHIISKGLPLPLNKQRTNITLDYILNYVGLPSEPKPHNALNGAIFEAEALSRLIYKKNLLPEFARYDISIKLKKK